MSTPRSMKARLVQPRHGILFAAALLLGFEAASADAPNLRARSTPIRSLNDLLAAPTASRDVLLVPPGKATPARTSATGDPFASRVAALRATRDPGASAMLQGEGATVVSRYRALQAQAVLRKTWRELRAQAPDLVSHSDQGTLVYLAGSDLGRTPDEFLLHAAPLLGLTDPTIELRLVSSERDALGMTHSRYQQVHRGLDVWAREAIVHQDASGRVVSYGGRLAPTPAAVDPARARLSADAARRAALAALAVDEAAKPGARAESPASALEIYVPATGAPVLVWRTRVAAAIDQVWDVFVNAETGAIVHRTSVVATDGPVAGSGIDLQGQNRSLSLYQVGSNYFNINATKPMYNAGASSPPQTVVGGIRVFDAQHGEGDPLVFSVSTNPNNWSGKAGHVSAAFNAGIVFDYFSQRHARSSIDGDGGTIELIVNFKNNFNNAFWNGQFMVFGNGDGNTFSDLAAALDVTAHEMTHGVVEHTANLVYETQSGALNESFADVFGACAEWFARPSTGNWLLGEEVTTPGTAGDALRNMQNPAASNVAFNGQQPTKMSEYENLPNTPQGDNGGVHINSGITNRAFYLFATNAALGATNADRIGKAERVYYRALANYLTRTAQFIDCRLAVIRAAEDLYGGAGNPVAQAAASAFDTVEIFGGDPSEPPPTLPPVEGAQYIGVLDAATNRLVRSTLDFQTFVPLSTVAVANKPSFSDDGEFVVFVDSTHRLRYALTDGSGEDFLSNQPVWRSIALSPDRSQLAATSTALDDSLYVLDLTGNGTDHGYAIHTPNYGGEGDDAAVFADFLDFSNNGQFVLYDCLNRRSTGSGTLEYWDINVLRVSDGAVQRIFPPQPDGNSIGNPSFSPTSDYTIVFDYASGSGVNVIAANLETGDFGIVTNNGSSPGRASFSTDATKVVYHYVTQQESQIWLVSLEPDGVTGAGDDALRANGGYDPTWFAIGERPSAVRLAGLSVAQEDVAARLTWEATVDAAHDHFVVLRDAGAGWESRSGALRTPVAPGSDRWEFEDTLGDVPRGVDVVRYAVQAVEHDGTSVVAGTIELTLAAPGARRNVVLLPNIPNPFNPTTSVRFSVDRRQPVRLDIYDAAGRRVRALWSGIADPGTHARLWNGLDDAGRGVASGSYVVRLESEGTVRSRKLSLVR